MRIFGGSYIHVRVSPSSVLFPFIYCSSKHIVCQTKYASVISSGFLCGCIFRAVFEAQASLTEQILLAEVPDITSSLKTQGSLSLGK
jgi:hypothetical protein